MYRLRNPDTWQWGPGEHILAGIYDGIQGGNWQRGGNKNAPKPKPLPRPGTSKPKRVAAPGEAVPLNDIRSEIARRRAQYETAAAAVPDEPQMPDHAIPAPPRRRRLTAAMVRSARMMAGHGIDLDVIAVHLQTTLASIERLIAGETYQHIT